jgi:hypothetical protein
MRGDVHTKSGLESNLDPPEWQPSLQTTTLENSYHTCIFCDQTTQLL